MFWIEYEVMSRSGTAVGSKTIKASKKDFMILGEFLTKVNALPEKTPKEIQKLMMQDLAFMNLIRKEHYGDFDSYTAEEIAELDKEVQYCIDHDLYCDEYSHFVYSYLDISGESYMGESSYFLGESAFYERHKNKDYEYTF